MNPILKAREEAESELMEKLADIEHERWADWQRHVHSKGIRDSSGIRLTRDLIERWDYQINTPYSRLTEDDKDKDRTQVMRYFPIIESYIHSREVKMLEALKEKIYGMGFKDPEEAGQFALHSGGYNQAIEEISSLLSDIINSYQK